MKQFIATILIISIVLSLGLNIFIFKPQKAQALVFGNILNVIKEWIVDALPKTVARHMMVRLQQNIARWAQGGFSDENKPFAMFNWKKEIEDALNIASGRFIEEFHLTPLCLPFRFSIGQTLGLALPYGYRIPYTQYAACTIETIVENAKEFWENPSITLYGWDTWTALAQPQNNIFGSALLAAQRRAEIEQEEKDQKELEKAIGEGYKSETECTEEQTMTDEELQDCNNDCYTKCEKTPGVPASADSSCIEACLAECQNRNTGTCLQTKTKNIGSSIRSTIEKAVGSDIDWLITADEITELLGLVFSAFLNKLIHGTGVSQQQTFTPSQMVAKYQAQYGYQETYEKALTIKDKKEIRKDILENILKSIKKITTSSYVCDDDNEETPDQLDLDVFGELTIEIIEEEAQHLYATMEGVGLKPDFIVLDRPDAKAFDIEPFYGATWDEISFSKYPPKCEAITGQKCSDVRTGLPFDLDLNKINPECLDGCLERINEYQEKCKEELENCVSGCEENEECKLACNRKLQTCNSKVIAKAVDDKKCSTTLVGENCLRASSFADTARNLCSECVKKAQDQCESKTDSLEKESCIKLFCSNYQNVDPSIASAKDFKKRCDLLELRDSCYACLKEYFMPASYCKTIADFVDRAYVKYPALINGSTPCLGSQQQGDETWWGATYKFSDLENCNVVSGMRCDAKFQLEFHFPRPLIPVGLTCRILPDLKFPETDKTCRDYCDVNPEELKDTADNEPSDLDCSGPFSAARDVQEKYKINGMWYSGGLYPNFQYLNFLIDKRAKCCVALAINSGQYKRCRGLEAVAKEQECTYGLPANEEPWCFCDEGYRPLGCTRTGYEEVGGGRGGDCADFDFQWPGNTVYGYTNVEPGGDMVYVGYYSCGEGEDGEQWDATAPSSTICEWETTVGSEGTWDCDLSGAGGTLHSGVYHADSTDAATGWCLCAPCLPSDDEYPYYGTEIDQCTEKVK